MRYWCIIAVALLAVSCAKIQDGQYELTVVATGDGHGAWFSEPFGDKPVRGSLMSCASVISALREEAGEDGVLLVDAGDFLTGGETNFYYCNVDSSGTYPYASLASAMGYDAVVLGQDDFGAPGLRRALKDMKKEGVQLLAGNAFRSSGKRVYPHYVMVRKGGLRVAVLGYSNAESSVPGLTFSSLLPLVQEDVDRVTSREKPHAVVVVAHTGLGKGNGDKSSSEGQDLYQSLRGVDFLVIGHDHNAKVLCSDTLCLLNAGKGGQNVAVGELTLQVEDGKVVSRELSASLVRADKTVTDSVLVETFRPEFDEVKLFCEKTVGTLRDTLVSRDFYCGQCPYLDFLHVLALNEPDVDISLGATLMIDRELPAGEISFNDISKVYPFDNSLIVLRMTGKEVRDYLEASYDAWVSEPDSEHVLRLKESKDYKTGQPTLKLAGSPANFDSAGGLCYTVDLTRPFGERVDISSLADGTPFDLESEYGVGITSYRASGSGRLLQAAGIEVPEGLDERTLRRGPEFRTLLYRYLLSHGSVGREEFSNPAFVGDWNFVPEEAVERIREEVELVFGKRQ